MIEGVKSLLGRRRVAEGAAHLALGERGEQLALNYLADKGYRIVATNFRVPLGRGFRGQKLNAEIDVVAYDGETLAFVEVKTRTSDCVASPERAVDLRKQRQIARAAKRYRQLMKVTHEPYRYDVVTLLLEPGRREIELLRGHFDDGVFRRSRYFRADA